MEYEPRRPTALHPRTDALPDCVVFPTKPTCIHDGNVIGLRASCVESKTDGCRFILVNIYLDRDRVVRPNLVGITPQFEARGSSLAVGSTRYQSMKFSLYSTRNLKSIGAFCPG